MIVSYNSYRLPDPGVCCSAVGVDTGSIGKVFSVLFLGFFLVFLSSLYKTLSQSLLQYLFLGNMYCSPTLGGS